MEFARYNEFKEKLAAIRRHFDGVIIRNNGAVIVKNSQGRHSIGVTRILNAYFKPSTEEAVKIAQAHDQGIELSKTAYRPTIDQDTFRVKFQTLAEEKVEYYDTAMSIDDILSERSGLLPIGEREFTVGTPSLVIRETPHPSAEFKHPCGSIDRTRYNTRTQKLTLIELKTSQFVFGTMKSQTLKEKHCKQLTMYAFLLQVMAKEANVPLPIEDLELVIVGWNSAKRTIAAWKLQYDPKTFLGGVWASERWHGIIDTGFLARLTLDELCSIPDCAKKALYKSSLHPDLQYCSQECRNKPHCTNCGRPASYKTSVSQKYFCKDCG